MTIKAPPIPNEPLCMEVEYKAKSSYPISPSASPEGTIGANILAPTYSEEQHQTWKKMFKKHEESTQGRLCEEYLKGLKYLNFTSDRIPSLADASEVLRKHTGWQVIRVDGLVSQKNFFILLANKVFPCTDFIRHIDEIDYTPAPDIFHDTVGHMPMITDPRFAEFFHLFGLAGALAKTEEEVTWLIRIYWFTVEFGLINRTAHLGNKRIDNQSRIYGSGIASSCGEIVYCLSDKVKKHPFQIDQIANTSYDIHHMQTDLFEISSFEELEAEFKNWLERKRILCT